MVLVTLGNRDLQFKKNIQKMVNVLEKSWFEENNDDKNAFIINKKKDFYEISQNIYEKNYEKFEKYFTFTMIEKTLKYIKAQPKNTSIIFVATQQPVPDRQDTHYIAKIAQRYYESKGYNCTCNFIECEPTNFSELLNHFLKLYESIPSDSKVYISNSGGTPDIRSATYFAGIFNNFEYLSINARTSEVNTQNFKNQEKILLKNIVKKMLDVYDYQGIIFLPLSEQIHNICRESLNYYNLNKKIEGNYGEKACEAINLLIQTAHVCYTQGRYAECLGRIYRIEEAVWHLLFYQFIDEKGFIDEKDEISYGNKKKKFNYIFDDHKIMKDFLLFHFSDHFEEKNQQLKLKGSMISTQSGKNFYWHFFNRFNKFFNITNFFKKINLNNNGEAYKSDSILNTTRNKSYLGHGFKGISKKDLENIFGDFPKFLDDLSRLLQKEIPNFTIDKIFDKKNQEILKYLE